MKRKQIYIELEQEAQLKSLAKERGVAEAALIREALDKYLFDSKPARPQLRSMKDHPLWKLVGIATGPDIPRDGAANHDHYLYGAPKVEE